VVHQVILVLSVHNGEEHYALSNLIDEKALVKAMSRGHFMNSVVMIEVGGSPTRTLPKDVQFHPVNDRPIHVDFLRIAEHATVTVGVPIRFINEEASPGLKRGGVLNSVRHELDLVCDASEMPEQIEIDLAGLEIGDSIHISHVTLPEGTTSAITDRDFTIATIVAPSGVKSEAADAAADAADAAAAEPAAGEVPLVGEEEAGEAQE